MLQDNSVALNSGRTMEMKINAVDGMLPEGFDIEITNDKSELVISKPDNDEVLGVLRFTNDREKGDKFGPDFVLETVYAGMRDNNSTTWEKLSSAVNFLVRQFDEDR